MHRIKVSIKFATLDLGQLAAEILVLFVGKPLYFSTIFSLI